MPDARQFALAEAATSAAWTAFAMRSALDTTQFAQRYTQVVAAIGRRQLTPDQVEHAIAESADWSAVAHEVAGAMVAFVDALSQRALLPVEHADASSAEPVSDRRDIASSHRADATALTDLLTKLATPDVSLAARRRALSRLNRSAANQTLGAAATAWFAMLDAVRSASLRTMNPALLTVLRAARPIGYDGAVIELQGPIATHATAQLDIENTLDRPASLRCGCHEVRRSDGIGPAFTPELTVTPGQQTLGARAEGGIVLALWLDESQFDAQATYVGALKVESDGGTTRLIPLRITTIPAQA